MDCGFRGMVKIEGVPLSAADDFKVTSALLETTYQDLLDKVY